MINWDDILSFAKNGNIKPDSRLEKTTEEWKEILTKDQYRITREKGTERAGSGAFCQSYEEGIYSCVCCNSKLFDSSIKYSSNSGWPSFTQPFKLNSISYIRDVTLGMERVEIICSTCDAHLGHVFPDGPAPSGLRYCVNSESIQLIKD
jgi:peptide-methionine (R)-S-oxide reductase